MALEPIIERTEDLIGHAWKLKAQLQHDPHRPTYHFMPPWAWMNDINGAIFWKGRYHIFYQHNPEGGYWKWMQWGHASSVSLVHWVHHPIALTPTLDGPGREGCYSGGAFVNTEPIYPTRPDSVGASFFSHGGSTVLQSVKAWDMAPAHEQEWNVT